MNQNVPVGQADWRVAEQEQASARDAVYLVCIGLLIGLVTGAIISIFRILKDGTFNIVSIWAGEYKSSVLGVLAILAAAAVAAFIVGRLIRNPAIRYGGARWIGQTLENGQAKPWLKILLPKFIGSWLVLGFGVSVGSEGPCIQMGAATAVGLKKFDSKQAVERRYFILGGCAAGLAAAFSAPFAGISYVYEIMNEKLSRPLFLFLLAGGIGVYISCTLVFGLDVMVPLNGVPLPNLTQLWLLLPLGIMAGITGVAYNYFLRWSIAFYTSRNHLPMDWRPMFPFIGAAIMLMIFPAITGEGTSIFPGLESGKALVGYLCFFILAKLIFTAYCYGSGIPAGLMVPVICLGAATGAVYADWFTAFSLLPPECAEACIAMGMAGAFAAAERAPITALILISEMTGSFAIMPGMLLVASVATIIARLAKAKAI